MIPCAFCGVLCYDHYHYAIHLSQHHPTPQQISPSNYHWPTQSFYYNNYWQSPHFCQLRYNPYNYPFPTEESSRIPQNSYPSSQRLSENLQVHHPTATTEHSESEIDLVGESDHENLAAKDMVQENSQTNDSRSQPNEKRQRFSENDMDGRGENIDANQVLEGASGTSNGNNDLDSNTTHFVLNNSALSERLVQFRIDLSQNNEIMSLEQFYNTYRDGIITHIRNFIQEGGNRPIKFMIEITLEMSRTLVSQNESGETNVRSETYTNFGLRSGAETIMAAANINQILQVIFDKFSARVDNFTQKGSNWVISRVLRSVLKYIRFTPERAGSCHYLLDFLPKQKMRAIVKVEANDERCFLYSVLCALEHYYCKSYEKMGKYVMKNWQELVERYKLDISQLSFPTSIEEVKVFAKTNKLPFVIVAHDKNDFFPYFATSHDDPTKFKEPFYLLFSSNEEGHCHFSFIRNIRALLRRSGKNDTAMHLCKFCFSSFARQETHERHQIICNKPVGTIIKGPKNDVMKFTNTSAMLKSYFVCYADFEAICKSADQEDKNKKTTKISQHIPCAYAYLICDINGDIVKQNIYFGEDAGDKFLEEMLSLADELYVKFKTEINVYNDVPAYEQYYDEVGPPVVCWICSKHFDPEDCVVRDHSHLDGSINGWAHRSCNLNYYERKWMLPIVLHNLGSYDSHFIINAVKNGKEITIIPKTMEKFLNITIGRAKFIDSFQFLSSSLYNLGESLKSRGDKSSFKILHDFLNLYSTETLTDDKMALLTGKQIFCYEYLDSFQKLKEDKLPSIECFYSSLTGSTVSTEDYQHAVKVWNEFNLTSLQSYCQLYLTVDVGLLASVFESFRLFIQEYYSLDPCKYLSLPGLALDGFLKSTNTEIELIKDVETIQFLHASIRGGLCFLNTRFAKSNLAEDKDYDPTKPLSTIKYFDCNNLYGFAMCSPLPIGGYKWLTESEVASFNIQNYEADGPIGFIIEADFVYPEKLHELHQDWPLLAENIPVKKEYLSPKSKELLESGNNMFSEKNKKLLSTLYDKTNYVLHSEMFRFALKHGLQVTKIHRILQFSQSKFLEPYVQTNTELRRNATDNFSSDLYKLMVNSVYGKFLESPLRRRKVLVIQDKNKLDRYTAKPTFKNFEILTNGLVLIEMKPCPVYLDKPVIVGFSILEISKLHMLKFFYEILKPMFRNNIKLLYSDTDSILFQLFHDNFDQMIEPIKDLYFDFSSLSKDHPNYSNKNKKTIGMFKDECGQLSIKEFIGLRCKLYSILLDETQKCAHKGISKANKPLLTHAKFKQVLDQQLNTYFTDNYSIRSFNHQLFTVKTNKLTLSSFYDKRHLLPNGIDSLPYGHYQIKKV